MSRGERILDLGAEAMDRSRAVVDATRDIVEAVRVLGRTSTPEELRGAVAEARIAIGLALIACGNVSEKLGALDEVARQGARS